MFLKALAKDLYRIQKEIEGLEKKLEGTVNVAEQEQLKDELRRTRAELTQIKKVLEGKKEQSRSSLYKPRSRF